MLHSFVHIVSTFWNDFLAPSHLWGTCLVSLPPLPGDHCVLYASTRPSATELLLLYLFIWFSSSVELISSSRVWGSFSCVLWYLIHHQYILGQSSVKSFCKGRDSKYFRYLGIFAGHVVSYHNYSTLVSNINAAIDKMYMNDYNCISEKLNFKQVVD